MNRAAHVVWIVAVAGVVSCKSVTEGSGARIVSVTIATPSVVLSQAETQSVAVTIQDADGNTLEDVSGVTWTSANNAIVSVTQGGRITGISLGGPVTVTVSVQGKSATTTVTVVPHRIEISPGTETIALGATRQLSGVAVDAAGNPIPGAGVITWHSGNIEVATVSSTGIVNSVAVGNATISASAAGRTTELELEVGVPTTRDGHWDGSSTASALIEFDVVFGTVRQFRLTVFFSTGACVLEATAGSAGITPIVNNAFQLLVFPEGTGPSSSVSGTFTSVTTMTGTHTGFRFQGLRCDGRDVATIVVAAGTIGATRQSRADQSIATQKRRERVE